MLNQLKCDTLIYITLMLQLAISSTRANVLRSKRHHDHDDNKQESYKPRILCWVLSVDTLHNNVKSKAIEDTWGPRCDKFLVVKNGTQISEQGNRLTLPITRDSRQELWHKVSAAFMHIHDHYGHQYDWIMKADDDAYVRVDSLRRFLADKSPSKPVYYGYKFKPFVRQGYMSGGPGYVLSREALRLLVQEGFRGNQHQAECNPRLGAVEDVLIGRCLEVLKVEAADGRDEKKREKFLPVPPHALLDPKMIKRITWLPSYAYYKQPNAAIQISSDPISFHYISPREMRLIDFLLYKVKGNQNDDDKKD